MIRKRKKKRAVFEKTVAVAADHLHLVILLCTPAAAVVAAAESFLMMSYAVEDSKGNVDVTLLPERTRHPGFAEQG